MRTRVFCIAVFLTFLYGIGPPTVEAATNRALGGIGGINNGTLTGGDGIGASAITLNSVNLGLVKQARNLAGTVLATGSDVASGNEIYFVLYVDNPTDVTALNIQLRDQLDESQFTYIAGTLETADLPSGSGDAAIWAGGWSSLSDNQDADIGSAVDSAPTDGNRDLITIGAEPTQPNAQLDISADRLRAVRFRVRVN